MLYNTNRSTNCRKESITRVRAINGTAGYLENNGDALMRRNISL